LTISHRSCNSFSNLHTSPQNKQIIERDPPCATATDPFENPCHKHGFCTKNPTHKPHSHSFPILLTDATVGTTSQAALKRRARSLACEIRATAASREWKNQRQRVRRHCQSRRLNTEGSGSLLLSDPVLLPSFFFLSVCSAENPTLFCCRV
jgi:hypothetical protein